MSKTSVWVVFVAVVMIGLHGQSVLAKTVVVGPSTCNPGPLHFATIQAGINAVAPDNTGTVLVCPGTYPEQVVISTSLTLRGIANGNADGVVITVPAGGLTPSVTTLAFGLVAAQVLVENTSFASIGNVTIDGSGNTCPTVANNIVGLEYFNVGTQTPPPPSGAVTTNGGNINNVTVRNELICGVGQGIDIENSFLTIKGNNIHDFDGTALTEFGGTTLITNNIILCRANIGVENAITLSGASQSVVSNNGIGDCPGVGVHVMGGSSSIVVSSNNMGPYVGLAIYLDNVSANNITGNNVNYADTGVWIAGGANNFVQNNTFTHMLDQGILDVSSLGGNSVLSNTVDESPIGIYQFNIGNDTIGQNNFYNVTALTAP